MPPRKRKGNDAAAVLAKMAAFLEAKNIEAPVVNQEVIDSVNDRDYGNSDAALLFAHHPPGFIPGKCKNCGAIYAVNRKSVGFCSDPCRREDWRKSTGLPWSAVSTRDVWDGAPPHVISPEQLKLLAGIADWFNTNRTILDTLAETGPESQEEEAEANPSDVPEILVQVWEPTIRGLSDQIEFLESLDLESDHTSNPQTNPPASPSDASLELSEEEASLFASW